MDHARFSPSSSDRIMACPASVKLSEAAPPERESAYASEGTTAHGLAELWLLSGAVPEALNMAGREEMREAVRHFVDYCNRLRRQPYAIYGVERRVRYNEEQWGTVDFICSYQNPVTGERVLEVVDFKYGAGVPVSPENNKQLLTYAAYAIEDGTLQVNWGYHAGGVRLTIVQPRTAGDPINSWLTEERTVSRHLRELCEAVAAAKADNAPAKAGDHCRWCRAKMTCERLDEAQRGLATRDPKDLDPAMLGKMLMEAAVVEQRIKMLREYAEQRSLEGEAIPGYKRVAKRAVRKWVDEGQVLTRVKNMRMFRKLAPTVLLSPTKCEKLYPEAYRSLAKFVEAKPSGTTLVHTSDPRPEVLTEGLAQRVASTVKLNMMN